MLDSGGGGCGGGGGGGFRAATLPLLAPRSSALPRPVIAHPIPAGRVRGAAGAEEHIIGAGNGEQSSSGEDEGESGEEESSKEASDAPSWDGVASPSGDSTSSADRVAAAREPPDSIAMLSSVYVQVQVRVGEIAKGVKGSHLVFVRLPHVRSLTSSLYSPMPTGERERVLIEEGQAFAKAHIAEWKFNSAEEAEFFAAAKARVDEAERVGDTPDQADEDALVALSMVRGDVGATDVEGEDWLRRQRRKASHPTDAAGEKPEVRAVRAAREHYVGSEEIRLAHEMRRVDEVNRGALDTVMSCIRGAADGMGYAVHDESTRLFGVTASSADLKRDREYVQLSNDEQLVRYLTEVGSDGPDFRDDYLFFAAPPFDVVDITTQRAAAARRAPSSKAAGIGGDDDDLDHVQLVVRSWQIVLHGSTGGMNPLPNSVIITGPDAENPSLLFQSQPDDPFFLKMLCQTWYRKCLGGGLYTPQDPPQLSWASYNRNGLKDGAEMTVLTTGTSLK